MSKRKPNRGSFKPGPDPRRHVFTTDERKRGYTNALDRTGDNAPVFAWLYRRVRGYYRAVKRGDACQF